MEIKKSLLIIFMIKIGTGVYGVPFNQGVSNFENWEI
jgi:hypothetical protein